MRGNGRRSLSRICGVPVDGLRCVLSPGHNRGKADVPENHKGHPDFHADTQTIRKWVNGGSVSSDSLVREMQAWLTFWGDDE